MKKITMAAILVLLAPLITLAAEYDVSMTDVNRIVCDAPVKDAVFSEEKGLVTKISGNDVFVKFPVTVTVEPDTGEKRTAYAADPAELFLVCGDNTHSLVLRPRKIPARTIALEPETKAEIKTMEYEGLKEEEILAALIKAAVESAFPAGFREKAAGTEKTVNRGDAVLRVIHKRTFTGSGYSVHEFHLYGSGEITVLPAEIAGIAGVRSPAAAMITTETVKGWARAFVIERSAK